MKQFKIMTKEKTTIYELYAGYLESQTKAIFKYRSIEVEEKERESEKMNTH